MKQERFDPQMYVAYYASHRGISIEEIGVAPIVVLSWGQKVIECFAEEVAAERCPNWFYDEDHIVYPLYSADVCRSRVSFAQCPEGAPATVMMMEEMIACGARVFIGLGWAGGLQRTAPVGSMLVPTGCVSEEGTSGHYLETGHQLAPDPFLVELLCAAGLSEGVSVLTGRQWSTDAPYRESVEKIESYQGQGVLGVDMETSAMYALGTFRGVQVCNLLVVSDELWTEWHPAFRSAKLQSATTLARRVILRCLERFVGYQQPVVL